MSDKGREISEDDQYHAIIGANNDFEPVQPVSSEYESKKSHYNGIILKSEDIQELDRAFHDMELLALSEGKREEREMFLKSIYALKIHKYIKQWTALMAIDFIIDAIHKRENKNA